ncbi:2Fe-2S iron-sulfur cluster-binding protein [Candidatus Kryptobacter tengchongensis]|uniref:Ferredoxin n=1 Tax=Kryptobacter tengchongensis TaxID=1643429 RepID=A0A916LIH5_KRYT1|nr:2Fe-2S iron-sulfur cluster-binding protein [Candidatus Kryptobacter tengchongensis]CUS96950.1 Ferredoxin [Candidatus Kryptobacter tengchongensis]
MPIIKFEREGRSIEVPKGANLRKAALKAGINVYKGINQFLNCQGHGLCGTCRVEIIQGDKNVNSKTPKEEWVLKGKFLIAHKVNPNLRLSCQVKVEDDIVVLTMPNYEIDKEETKERIKIFAVATFFGLLFLAGLALIVFDFLGKI